MKKQSVTNINSVKSGDASLSANWPLASSQTFF